MVLILSLSLFGANPTVKLSTAECRRSIEQIRLAKALNGCVTCIRRLIREYFICELAERIDDEELNDVVKDAVHDRFTFFLNCLKKKKHHKTLAWYLLYSRLCMVLNF